MAIIPVTETYPSTLPAPIDKNDAITVPVGEDDLFVDAAEMNDLGSFLVSLGRSVRLQAAIVALAPTTAGINGKAFRIISQDATTKLANISTTLTAELDRQWASAIEKIEEGGDLDGTASAKAFFGVAEGIVSVATGTFVTGGLIGLSTDGSLITYAAGNLPPIGRAIDATTVYIDMTGRVRADNITINYNASGQLTADTTGLAAGENFILAGRIFS